MTTYLLPRRVYFLGFEGKRRKERHMIQETPGRIFTPDFIEKSATKRMEYHTERIVTLKCDRSVFVAIVLAGIFFVMSAYLSH